MSNKRNVVLYLDSDLVRKSMKWIVLNDDLPVMGRLEGTKRLQRGRLSVEAFREHG